MNFWQAVLAGMGGAVGYMISSAIYERWWKR